MSDRQGAPHSEHDELLSGIAIIGIAGRFPGAASVAQMWDNVASGLSSIRNFCESELEDNYSSEIRASDTFVKARAIMDDVDLFDAAFFGMQPREAALTDPQQRVFLELCWHTLEDAGYDPARYEGAIGVFAGSSLNTYLLRHVLAQPGANGTFTSDLQVGSYDQLLGALQDFLPTRVAYKLNLRGPAIAVQTACSTSLTAVAEACKSLMLFECDMALAGGVSITFPQKRGYQHLEGGIVSADGKCRPFDAAASGTVFGDGAAVVTLKRLEDALADRDHIYGVVRGWGLNNDGGNKVSFSAPSVQSQARAIAMAHAMAGIDAGSVGYVECHGTATPLGDPIEFAGLKAAFGDVSREQSPCWLGSAKGNLGHLDAAAGVTGLIKTVLMMQHEAIPPLAHFTAVNPNIDLTETPFAFNATTVPWVRSSTPRRCGVSAFGVGGTNVHVVVQEAPAQVSTTLPAPASTTILTLSARTSAALDTMREALASHLERHPDIDLADAAFTLFHGRRLFAVRCAVAAQTVGEAVGALRAAKTGFGLGDRKPPVIFLFPGQGAQRCGMARALVASSSTAKSWVDRGLAHLAPDLARDVADYLFSTKVDEDDEAAPDRTATRIVQPALFLIEIALARALMAAGVTPSAMIGHSLGEFAAAVLADVMPFEAALDLVSARAQLMQNIEPGGMLAVRLSAEAVQEQLSAGLEIAAINGPAICTVAGPLGALAAFEAHVVRMGIAARRLHTSHAFHSAMMDPIVEPLQRLASAVALEAPQIPIVSTMTGVPLSIANAIDPCYWAQHCRRSVRFADAVRRARLDYADAIFLDVGPGETLGTLAALAKDVPPPRAIAGCLRDGAANPFFASLGLLWSHGVDVDLEACIPANGRRISLPGYAFERTRHWIDQPVASAATTPSPIDAVSPLRLAVPIEIDAVGPPFQAPPGPATMSDIDTRCAHVVALIEDLTGAKLGGVGPNTSFFDLGFDSLLMAQVAARLRKSFNIKVTFRQLMRDYPTIAAVAALLPAEAVVSLAASSTVGEQLPASAPNVPASSAVHNQAAAPPAHSIAMPPPLSASAGEVERILAGQLATLQQIIGAQLQVLSRINPMAEPALAPLPLPAPIVQNIAAAQSPPAALPPAAADSVINLAALSESQSASRFKVYSSNGAHRSEISPKQRDFIADLTARYSNKSPKTKAYVQSTRQTLADPRTAAGFRAEWKEMVFPIIAERAKGSRIWDMDGNDYVDLVNGYGQTMFGHSPDFVINAVSDQMQLGFPIGPQTALAGEVAGLFAHMTGHERVSFCNTGSEAVMAAVRLARTVTGRDRIVSFAGDYHGQFDEVLVKGSMRGNQPGAAPICPGIPDQSVANMVVLPYGNDESMAWIAANISDIAAVLVEPVQSRHPALQPVAFLQCLRELTKRHGTALIVDEIVTGFRVAPGGAQQRLGIKGDLATYGKVVGGGMPIGVLAGSAEFMDALDGGHWSFGDDSVPEAAPTFFAGTFVRHPLVLAAARSVLAHIGGGGSSLYDALETKTAALVDQLNEHLTRRGIAPRVERFASWFHFDLSRDDRLSSLLYFHMRLQGIHIQEGFPCFLTTAHTTEDIRLIERAFANSLDALLEVGILVTGQALEQSASPVDINGQEAADLATRTSPLTEAQQEIYLVAQLGDAASTIYNESITLDITGDLDAHALRAALSGIIERHEALRATFNASGETISVAATAPMEMATYDLSNAADATERFAHYLEADSQLAFDLERGPLVRAALFKKSDTSHALVFTAHHLICDGWSMGVLLKELGALYAASKTATKAELPPPGSFLDFARSHAVGTSIDATADSYWRRLYQTFPAPLDLPADRPRPKARTYQGASATAHFSGSLLRRLKDSGARSKATLFAVLFCSVQTLLGKLAGSADVVMAVPAAGQSLVDEPSLVGHCVNFLPVRSPFDFDEPFSAHLERTVGVIYEALDHQDYTLGTLMRQLDIDAAKPLAPLTRVQFNLEKIGENLDFGGLETHMRPNPKGAVYFDLFFNFIEGEDGIRLDIDYATEMFDLATIDRWMAHLGCLLERIAAAPASAINDLDLLSADQAHWLITASSDCVTAVAVDQPAHRLFEQHAIESPDAVAVICGHASLTYRELDAAADALAARVRDMLPGSPPGQRIAILVDRSLHLPVALLAVWKAGHAYMPLDPTQPAARLKAIFDIGKPAAVISTFGLGRIAPAGVPLIELANESQPTVVADHAKPDFHAPVNIGEAVAYVIFTSGTTGVPKGVEVTHLGLANVLQSMQAVPGFTSRDRMLAVSTIAFDVAQGELFIPLTSGGSVEIVSADAMADAGNIAARLQDPAITHGHATPSLWQIISDAGFQPRPGLTMMYSGEPIQLALAQHLTRGGEALWNCYGPTETSIWSSVERVSGRGRTIPIGRPVANTQLFILDAHQRLAVPGVVGDLWIGGHGLAKGYFNRPDLTAAAFQTIILRDGRARRLYRTGDLACRSGDGSITLLGRADNQIKLSGYRIELAEIEHSLGSHPAVADCAVGVFVLGDGDKRLAAYFVARPGENPQANELSAFIGARLPAYMVPNLWRRLDAMPLSLNGKLDRSALPQLGPDDTVGVSQSLAQPGRASPPTPIAPSPAPQTSTDRAAAIDRALVEQIRDVWASVLNAPSVPLDQPLLSLGARSLHLFRIASQLQKAGVPVTARMLMANPTVEGLATLLGRPKVAASAPTAVAPSLASFRRAPSSTALAPAIVETQQSTS